MIKYTMIITSLIILYSYPILASDAVDGIGVYFDEDALYNCLPDSTNFPIQLSAFVILKNVSSFSGISGWEARLVFSENLYASLHSISGNAINASTFPEFVVGLESPLPADSLVVLCELDLFITGPGEIFIEPSSVPSIPGAATPLYAIGDNPSTFVPMSYSYGAPELPVASVGVASCPQYQSGEGDNGDSPIIDLPLLDSTQTRPLFNYNTGAEQMQAEGGPTLEDIESMNLAADICFRGQVVDYEFGCYLFGGRRIGACLANFEVLENFWGTDEDSMEIIIDGYSIPSCLIYRTYFPRPEQEIFQDGAEFIIFATSANDRYLIAPYGIFPHVSEKTQFYSDKDYTGRDILDFIVRTSSIISYDNQYRNADLVIECTLLEFSNPIRKVAINRIIKGTTTQSILAVDYERNDLVRAVENVGRFGPKLRAGDKCLLFLKHDADDKYFPLASGHSFLGIRNGGYMMNSGILVKREIFGNGAR